MLQIRCKQYRLDFSSEFFIRYDEADSWDLRILWKAEAYFFLTDNVISKNCVRRADNNPRDVTALMLPEGK